MNRTCIDKHVILLVLHLAFSFRGVARQDEALKTGEMGTECRLHHFPATFHFKDEESIREWIMKDRQLIPSGDYGLRLLSSKTSMKGHHHSYSLLLHGIPVYRSILKVNTDLKGRIRNIIENTAEIPTGEEDYELTESLKRMLLHQGMHIFKTDSIWYFDGTDLHPCLRIVYANKDGSEVIEKIHGAEGNVIAQHNLNAFLMNPQSRDTIAKGFVYLPDPLTTAGVTYGGVFSDRHDSTNAALDKERKIIAVPVSFDKDTFRLAGPYAALKELSDPVTPVTVSLQAAFYFDRSMPGFEDINAYYHILSMHERIRSLGFTGVTDYPIEIDAHALNGAENSMFVSTTTPPRILLGTGGVDDAEDADVIVHEYGHAIHFSISPDTNFGYERNALEEGNCDYLAACYSKDLDDFRWDYLYSWDGQNEFWPGRIVTGDLTYPQDMTFDIYHDGNIWTSAILEIRDKIGADIADRILIESLYSYANNISMNDAACLYLTADSLLFGGVHSLPIAGIFASHGFSMCTSNHVTPQVELRHIKVNGTLEFFEGNSDMMIHHDCNHPAHYTINDLQGRIIRRGTVDQNCMPLSPDEFKSGAYFARIYCKSQNLSFRFLRK
jgi:hypothetical protein